MYKFALVGTVLSYVAANQGHPVHKDIVDEIKQKATTWKPLEVNENPFANKSIAEIYALLGTKNRPFDGVISPN